METYFWVRYQKHEVRKKKMPVGVPEFPLRRATSLTLQD